VFGSVGDTSKSAPGERGDMKSVDDLTESAAELTAQGLSRGEIADELNVSRETAAWLVDRADPAHDDDDGGGSGDIHVDWSTVGRDGDRLAAVGRALADVLSDRADDVGLTVGVEKAGAPLATTVASALDTDLATYSPRKHQWEEGDLDEGGTFSRNFASVEGRRCYVVDDIVTSGTTMAEAVRAVRAGGGDPVACGVIADKSGSDDIEGVPVGSLLDVLRVND
jgi:orotate phosphoribosyltransferase